MKLTRAFVAMLRRKPLNEAQRRTLEAEEAFYDALAESDSDGVFGMLDPIPERRPADAKPPPGGDRP